MLRGQLAHTFSEYLLCACTLLGAGKQTKQDALPCSPKLMARPVAAVRASLQVAAGQSPSCPSQVLGDSDLQCTPFLVGPLHLVLFWTSVSPHAALNCNHLSGLGVE